MSNNENFDKQPDDVYEVEVKVVKSQEKKLPKNRADEDNHLIHVIEDGESKVIRMACPICGGHEFDEIHLVDRRRLRWNRKYEMRIRLFWSKTQAYRCVHCEYILLFGR